MNIEDLIILRHTIVIELGHCERIIEAARLC